MKINKKVSFISALGFAVLSGSALAGEGTPSCYETDWGPEASCAVWPRTNVPACRSGYTLVRISDEFHTGGGCIDSPRNVQKVKATCCTLLPKQALVPAGIFPAAD
jgi:hypothetical protein